MVEFFPIRELSPYHRSWTIKARVTTDPKVREFTSGRGGKVCSVDLLDKNGDQIRASFWNDACDKYCGILVTGKVFTFAKGTLKVADKRFNSLSHPYEITFNTEAIVTPAEDDAGIEQVKYQFSDLKTVSGQALPFQCDILGIATFFEASKQITSGERNFSKATLHVCDASGYCLEIGIWGEQGSSLNEADFANNPVVALKGVRVQEYNGRTGSLTHSGTIVPGFDSREAKALRTWWEAGGRSQDLVKLSDSSLSLGTGNKAPTELLTLAETRDKSETLGSEAQYWDTIVRLSMVQTQNRELEPIDIMYNSCQELTERNGRSIACNKKVDDRGYCPVHDNTAKTAWRWKPRAQFVDESDSLFLGVFENEFTTMIGKTANEAFAMKENGTKIESVLKKKYFEQTYKLRIRANIEEYQGQSRPKVNIVSARPVSYGDRARQYLFELKQYVPERAAGA